MRVTCPPEKRYPGFPGDFVSPRPSWYPWGMNRIVACVCCLRSCLSVLLQLVGYLLRFCWALALPRAVTAAQLLAIQSQLKWSLRRRTVPALLWRHPLVCRGHSISPEDEPNCSGYASVRPDLAGPYVPI